MLTLILMFSGFVSNGYAGVGVQGGGGKSVTALVYRGAGGCNSCAEAAAKVARSLGLQVTFISPSEIKPDVFEGASLWIQPAGNAITAAKALGGKRLRLIRSFVESGGAYVGFCAGAFLADRTVDNEETIPGLGIIPVSSADYDAGADSDDGTFVWTRWGGRKRHIFFRGGGTFRVPPKQNRGVLVLATYEKDGLPATIQVNHGRGTVVITGAHPEAPNTWKERAEQEDRDGDDLDLAQEMVRRALE